jgi:hypothetical protein
LQNTTGESQPEEPPVFFLDRTFGRNELASMLRPQGFTLFTMYDEFGEAESKIADPVMIQDCGLKNRVLLTGDQQLVRTWAREIVEANIAVFVVTDNNEGPKKWGPRIIAAKQDIFRELRRRQKPFTARISTEGHITQVRLYEDEQWRNVEIGKKNPPHISKYSKRTESEST